MCYPPGLFPEEVERRANLKGEDEEVIEWEIIEDDVEGHLFSHTGIPKGHLKLPVRVQGSLRANHQC